MTKPLSNSFYTLRTGFTIYPAQHKVFEQLLATLVHKIPARFVVLTDVSGQFVAARGDQGKINLVALGSLMAGDLAASQEIARLIGEYQDYQMILREGRTSHTFITEAGHHLVLLVEVPAETPLGWARMLIQETAHKLAQALEEKMDQPEPDQLEPIFAEEELSNLFEDAFNDLWQE